MIDYNYLYKKLNFRTPLKADCGKLCGGACCKSEKGENEAGMYLFPGEEKKFINLPVRIEETDFCYGENNAKILFCDGICERKIRPLACRIFPLFPYVDTFGELKVITDPGGNFVCPLCGAELCDFNGIFVRGVKSVGKYLMNDKEGFAFLYALSRMKDEYYNIKK